MWLISKERNDNNGLNPILIEKFNTKAKKINIINKTQNYSKLNLSLINGE
jgi:hypothetical protein